ncbi:MAG: DUF72 domain-containing protein [Candidatus Aminicenantes bacterium]|nr:DUF72 domain-containing protein [Candidatus Aminicenantes bacterium]
MTLDPAVFTHINAYRFRDFHPSLFLGTTSDRYAGWMGQIYTADKYEGRITSRTKVLDGKTYYEEVLPVESVSEYFTHFPALELDFTFYRPLLDQKGEPTSNLKVLETYARYIGSGDSLIVKVPQAVTARKIRKGEIFIDNPDYLDPDLFTRRFYEPLVEICGPSLQGLIFEQEYSRKSEGGDVRTLAAELDRFLKEIPDDDRYHFEIRTSRFLDDPLFQVLNSHGTGLLYSHWTWLPRLAEQMDKVGEKVNNRAGAQVVRLLTPRGMTYSKTYAAAHPFDRMVEGQLRDDMIEDTLEVIRGVLRQGKRLFLLINNRFGGNAPDTARILLERVL